jgi:hypothetical protein
MEPAVDVAEFDDLIAAENVSPSEEPEITRILPS